MNFATQGIALTVGLQSAMAVRAAGIPAVMCVGEDIDTSKGEDGEASKLVRTLEALGVRVIVQKHNG
jgi:hypothetical protein